MKTTTKVLIIIAVLFGLGSCGIVGSGVIHYNQTIDLWETVDGVQEDAKAEFDQTWKNIQQTAQVTSSFKDTFIQMYGSIERGRSISGDGDVNAFLAAVREENPTLPQDTFLQLQRTIVSSRDQFTRKQRELLSLDATLDARLKRLPWGPVMVAFGVEPFEIYAVTSDRTNEAFETNIDNNVDLNI